MSPLRLKTILLLMGFLGVLIMVGFANLIFPFTTDSVIYVSTAEQFKQFRGMQLTNVFVSPAESDYIPSILQPPGYSMLIAFFSLTGLDILTSGILVPRICFLFLPVLFFMVYRKVMSVNQSLIAAFISTFMFSTIRCALFTWSDIPYLLFALLSIIICFHILDKGLKASIITFFMLGIVTGFAFLIRYVGLPLAAALFCGLLIGAVLKSYAWKDVFKAVMWGAIGWALPVAPLFIRNKVMFGTFQPYQVPPSLVPLGQNIKDYLEGLAEMIFAQHSFDKAVMIIGIIILVSFLVKAKDLIIKEKKLFIFCAILILYFFFNSAFLVYFKTFFYAPEEINERYLIQIGWILVGAIVFGVDKMLKELNQRQPLDQKSIVGLILFCFVVIQIFPVTDHYYAQKRVRHLTAQIGQFKEVLRSLPPDYVIVSNMVEHTYFHALRNVRMLNGYTPYGLMNSLGRHKKFVVLLVKQDVFLSDAWKYAPHWENAQGYRKLMSTKDIDLLIPQQQLTR